MVLYAQSLRNQGCRLHFQAIDAATRLSLSLHGLKGTDATRSNGSSDDECRVMSVLTGRVNYFGVHDWL